MGLLLPKRKPATPATAHTSSSPEKLPADQLDPALCNFWNGVVHCPNPAGHKTLHEGMGYCSTHGGNVNTRSGVQTVKTEYKRYGCIKTPRLVDLLAHFNQDPDPLDLLPDVELLRTIIADFVNRAAELNDAVLAWHNSYSPEYQDARKAWARENMPLMPYERAPEPNPVGYGKPRQIIDVSAAGGLIEKLSTLSDRITRQRSEGSLTMDTVNKLWEQMGVDVLDAVSENVEDAATRTKLLNSIETRWKQIRVAAGKLQREQQ
jgi:hypothetical protein